MDTLTYESIKKSLLDSNTYISEIEGNELSFCFNNIDFLTITTEGNSIINYHALNSLEEDVNVDLREFQNKEIKALIDELFYSENSLEYYIGYTTSEIEELINDVT